MKSRLMIAVGAVCTLSFGAFAFPIAPLGTEGFAVTVGNGAPVLATYEGNSASYSNDLYLELDALGNPGLDGSQANDLFIFNNHANSPGDTLNLGAFVPGTELIFRLHVHNTGYDYYSGPAGRNPDGMPHARVQDNWNPGVTLVSFEDLYGTPEYPGGYNDLSFSFSNTRGTPTPDTMPTALGLGVALGCLAYGSRRRVA